MAQIKNFRKRDGEEWVIGGELNVDGGKITAAGSQAAAIADISESAAQMSQEEREKFNAILEALRGAGIIDST